MMKFFKSVLILIFLQLAVAAFCFEAKATTEEVLSSSINAKATPEDQIPLKIMATEKNEDKNSNGQKVIFTIGILLTLAGVGYYAVRRFTHSNKPGKSNMQIKVLSQHYLGPKKSLAIIRVAGESMIIGITDQNISMIKSLALLDDELPQVLPKNFSESMSEELTDQDIQTDEFSFEGIKSTVAEKIKSMRNIQ